MPGPHKQTNIPKWLIAEDVRCERWFIMHTEWPRFVGEIFEDEETGVETIGFPEGEIEFVDQVNFGQKTAQKMARLMREAGEALELYDAINEEKAEHDRLEAEDDEC